MHVLMIRRHACTQEACAHDQEARQSSDADDEFVAARRRAPTAACLPSCPTGGAGFMGLEVWGFICLGVQGCWPSPPAGHRGCYTTPHPSCSGVCVQRPAAGQNAARPVGWRGVGTRPCDLQPGSCILFELKFITSVARCSTEGMLQLQ